MMTNIELRAAPIAAFPPLPITRATIHTADARWAGYEERDDLPLIEGKSWVELAPEILERHAALLVHAGGALYRAILPAYLLMIVGLRQLGARRDRGGWRRAAARRLGKLFRAFRGRATGLAVTSLLVPEEGGTMDSFRPRGSAATSPWSFPIFSGTFPGAAVWRVRRALPLGSWSGLRGG